MDGSAPLVPKSSVGELAGAGVESACITTDAAGVVLVGMGIFSDELFEVFVAFPAAIRGGFDSARENSVGVITVCAVADSNRRFGGPTRSR